MIIINKTIFWLIKMRELECPSCSLLMFLTFLSHIQCVPYSPIFAYDLKLLNGQGILWDPLYIFTLRRLTWESCRELRRRGWGRCSRGRRPEESMLVSYHLFSYWVRYGADGAVGFKFPIFLLPIIFSACITPVFRRQGLQTICR